MGMDLHALKRKFPFLLEYSDTFIKETRVYILIKAETASRKLIELDRSKSRRDRLEDCVCKQAWQNDAIPFELSRTFACNGSH